MKIAFHAPLKPSDHPVPSGDRQMARQLMAAFHLVDVSDSSTATEGSGRPDPVDDYNTITAELKSFDPVLAAKPTLVVASKADIANSDKLKKLRAMAKRKKLPLFEISPVTGEGIDKLKYAIADAVHLHRGVAVDAPPPEAPKKRKPRFPPPASSSHGSRSR